MSEWNEITVSDPAPSEWSISVLPDGRIKTTGGLVAFIDGRRALPWRRVVVGETHHISARNRRTPRDLLNVARGQADRLRVKLDAHFAARRDTEQNLINRARPTPIPEDIMWKPYAVTPEEIAKVARWTSQTPEPVDYWDRPNRWVRFAPMIRHDVKPEALPWIDGEPFEVEFAGTMDDGGTYDGQAMWMPVRGQGPRVAWLPDCDLTDVPRT